MNIPTVSVIIPAYNSADFIEATIQSVLCQVFNNYEIIVVDDGSTDETPSIIQKFCSQITYIRQENLGPSAARNRGIAESKGQYLVFVDSDDLMMEGMLERQYTFLENHPDIALVYSNGYRFKIDSRGNEIKLPLSVTGEVLTNDNYEYQKELIIRRNPIQIDVAMVRKESVLSVGGFDESLTACEDWDLWFRIFIQSKFAYLDIPVMKYRSRSGSNSADTLRNIANNDRVAEKISETSLFLTCTPISQSEFYFSRAVNALFLKKKDLAEKFYKQSIRLANNKKAKIGLFIFRLFGLRSVWFYKLKRRLFGVNGITAV